MAAGRAGRTVVLTAVLALVSFALSAAAWSGDSSPSPLPLADAELSSPAVVASAEGRLELFWVSDGRLRHQVREPGGGWSRELDLGGDLRSQPAAVESAGHLDVFARGEDDTLLWRSRTAEDWGEWESLGGRLTSAPAAVSWGDGRLDVFVRGGDNAMRRRTLTDGSWSGWRRLGGMLTSSPAAASWGPGRLDVVARGVDGRLLHRGYQLGDGWSPWRRLGGRLSAQPAMAAPAEGHLEVLARVGGGGLEARNYRLGAGWTASRRVGDAVFTSAPAMSTGPGAVVAAVRRANEVHLATRTASGWSSWGAVDPLAPFRGLGTWVDVYDYRLDPAETVAAMKERGVRTLFISSARFTTPGEFHDEAALGAWLDEAHRAGLAVVGWYPPAYGDMARDVRRTLAIARYVSPGGQRFDAVGVDIERFGATGEVDRDTFNARVVPHLRRVRARTDAVLAAIVPSPFNTDPGNNWEGFPWSGVGAHSDVLVPMALWTFRRHPDDTPWGPTEVHAWVVDQVVRTQALTGRPVHVEGGVDDPGQEYTPPTPDRVRAFVQAAHDAGAIGGSHYDYATTEEALWPALGGLNR